MIMTHDTVIQGFFMGLIAAVLGIGYNKLVIGKFVKALIKSEANHPLRAKTFEQLGIAKTIFIKVALRRGGTLRRIVYEPEDGEMKGYFYIPEDKLYRAGRIYGGKDVDMLMIAAVLVVLFLFCGIVLLYMPALMNAISNTFSFGS